MLGFNEKAARNYANKVLKTPLIVEIDPQLILIAESQAKASHEGWLKGKAAQGYTYGKETNDDPKKGPLTNPLMVPYEELPEDVKQSNMANAVAVLKILKSKNVTFVNFTQYILYPLAKQIHDEWCREKLKSGWVWGPVTDKSKKIHRDLISFEALLMNPELKGDVAYDVDTAKQIIIKLISDADIYPVISDLKMFKLEDIASLA
ncbi:MAG: hypothetical protein IKN74_01100 [Clostridia bacterium]|nr:hypothetical protein [Bacilli bacterium]MBR3511540.1 hypothetical protein [Clostridia bacterium]